MSHQRGDVVITLFPFADGLESKRRPALVCSGPWRVKKSIEVCWISMITTTVLKGWPGDIDIGDLKTAGLPRSSIVRVLKVACIDTRNIIKKVGKLDRETLQAVEKEMRAFLK